MGQEQYREASGVLVIFSILLTSTASPSHAQGQERETTPDSPFLFQVARLQGRGSWGQCTSPTPFKKVRVWGSGMGLGFQEEM